eukprot:Opistho-1_new@83101
MASAPHEYESDGSDDEALIRDLKAGEPKFEDGVECIVVVDNVPKVTPDKEAKLISVLSKIFSQFGELREEGIHLPRDESGMGKGFAFIEYATPPEAQRAIKQANGYKLDKQHVFEVCAFADIERFSKVPEKYTEPEAKTYAERDNHRWWLLNENCLDQFVTRYENKTEIAWNARDGPDVHYKRDNWTDTYVTWSPNGTYLTTIHRQGIALWGGPKWSQITRLSHPGVKLFDYSPCEKYVVTWSNEAVDDPNDPQSVIVWDVRTGQKLRGFPTIRPDQWPVFKWSHDDNFVARMGDDAIAVYEVPSMRLLDKKTIKIPGVREFSWSPSDDLISFWVPESGNNPARVTIMHIPSREERSVKNLFNVNDCKMHWQPNGDYLCVKVDRHTKTKKSTFTNFEFFRMREKGIPVDVLELKDTIMAFAWEPCGPRFALIHGEAPRISVSFYSLEDEKKQSKVVLLRTLEKKAVNHLFWSPKGQYIVLAGLRNMNGALEFWDVNDMVCMNVGEHFMATDVEWDPTGRYVATSVSFWRHQMETGYALWSFQGRLLRKANIDKFYQFLWRPRPKTLLTKEQIKNIKKNLKQYSSKFDRQDLLEATKLSKEVVEKRKRLMDDWREYREGKLRDFEEDREERVRLRDGWDEKSEAVVDDQETIEVFVKEEVSAA